MYLVPAGDPRLEVRSFRSDHCGVTVPRADHGVRRQSQEYIAHRSDNGREVRV